MSVRTTSLQEPEAAGLGPGRAAARRDTAMPAQQATRPATAVREPGHDVVRVGVDGCRGGWFAAWRQDGALQGAVFGQFDGLATHFPQVQLMLVDIPVGLPWRACPRRHCEDLARQLLRAPRASSVFPVPCRAAAHAASHAEAARLNQEELARSLSKQAFGICPKIAEVDQFLRVSADRCGWVHESHPEVCFAALNGGRAMAHGKKSGPGAAERLALLERVLPGSRDFHAQMVAAHRRALLAADDVSDALVLLATAAHGPLVRLAAPAGQGYPDRDEAGLPMHMICPPFATTLPLQAFEPVESDGV